MVCSLYLSKAIKNYLFCLFHSPIVDQEGNDQLIWLNKYCKMLTKFFPGSAKRLLNKADTWCQIMPRKQGRGVEVEVVNFCYSNEKLDISLFIYTIVCQVQIVIIC